MKSTAVKKCLEQVDKLYAILLTSNHRHFRCRVTDVTFNIDDNYFSYKDVHDGRFYIVDMKDISQILQNPLDPYDPTLTKNVLIIDGKVLLIENNTALIIRTDN